MNPGLVVKLRPAGPWRIGPDSGARNRVDAIYHSDSLYSAVTSAMARLGSLEEWLDATARNGAAAVCFSSCFPFVEDIGFIVPPRTIWPPAPPAVSARLRWKSARFVPLEVVGSILSGRRLDENHWYVDGPSECLMPAGRPGPFRTGVRWNAAVDRLTGATERHSTACIEFRSGAGLWTVVSFNGEAARDRWLPPVKAAFRLLADTGFGGERSRGWGRAETPEFVEGTLPEMILPEGRGRENGGQGLGAGGQGGEAAVQESSTEVPPAPIPEPPAEQPQPEPPVEEPQPEPPIEEPPAPEPPELTEGQAEVQSAPDIAPLAITETPDTEASMPPESPALEESVAETPEADLSTPPDSPTPDPRPPVPEQAPQPPAPEQAAELLATEEVPPVLAAPEPPAPGPQPPAPVSHAHWLLSLFTPAAADGVDWRRGSYSVLVRGGRVESPVRSGELKKQVQMVAEGSVIFAVSAPRGSAVDVAPDAFEHPVYRAGFAVSIPLPEAR